VEAWLSAPRFAAYVTAMAGDRRRALHLYDWNASITAAFLLDLGHLEVALRNAYDGALSLGVPAGGRHWVFDPPRYFPTRWKTARNGVRYNTNQEPQRLLAQATQTALIAVQAAARASGRPVPSIPPPGKVVAELPFGFWRFLTAAKHEKRLWVPHLHRAFAAGTSRSELDRRVSGLHELRNRAAHHEPLLRRTSTTGVFSLCTRHLVQRHDDLLVVAQLISPDLSDHLAATSSCLSVLARRPRADDR